MVVAARGNALDDGISSGECRGRAECGESFAKMLTLCGLCADRLIDRAIGGFAQSLDIDVALLDGPKGVRENRAAADLFECARLPLDPAAQRRCRSFAKLGDEISFRDGIGDHALGRIGRRRGAEVGNMVAERAVRFVPDRADDRSGRFDDRPAQCLVREGE